jgi:membrane-associated phospholipid phosphatase
VSSLSDLNDRLFLAVNEMARDTAWLHGTAVAFAKYGVVLFALALVVGAVYYGRGSSRALAAAVWAGIATLVAVAVNQPIGNAFGEHRPYAAHPHALLLISPTSDFSFPSDHAVMAGAVAAGVWIVSRRLGAVVAVLAVLMAAARVYVGAHYPGDVVVGLALGAMVSCVGWWVLGDLLTRTAESLRESRLRPILVATGSARPRPR